VNLERSPNTVETYARYLAVLGVFDRKAPRLAQRQSRRPEYIYWLRVGGTDTSIQGVTAIRSERTVNHAMTAVHTLRVSLALGQCR